MPSTWEELVELAKEIGIKVPRGKKGVEEAKELAMAEASDDAALKALEENLGLTAAAQKKRQFAEADENTAARRAAAKAVFDARKAERAALEAAGLCGDGGGTSSAVAYEVACEWDWPAEKEARKAVVDRTADLCRTRGVRLPADESNMKIGIAQVLAATKVGDKLPMEQVLLNLAERFGASGGGDGGGGGASATGGSSDGGSATKKQKKALEVVCDENRSMAEAFKELANYAFKSGDKFKGVTYQRVATTVAEWPEPMTKAPPVGSVKGVGKASCEKITEFINTGALTKLEEYRANA